MGAGPFAVGRDHGGGRGTGVGHVRLANGKTKPIEQVKPGDKVLATDPKTGKAQAKAVVAAFSGTRYNSVVGITVDTDGERGQRTGVIYATEHHLFWDAGTGSWIRADQLRTGTLLRSPNGTTSPVVGVADHATGRTVHDITVADTHTFYVHVGATAVLVHNEGPFCGRPIGGKVGDALGDQNFHGSDYTLNEFVEFVASHAGDDNPAWADRRERRSKKFCDPPAPFAKGDQNASDFK
ncbi:polymorphic toxin-type HINT domain-containing protein [Nonomuraea solani]|uniref:polymorphic toxin-type HINT domain-containing protein n=1 Tax=Nonomuraea solani TaxID=1144553 RepID=UPI001358931A|nr:polymorphic toxin-type HINT domain-containing protein [Nonomuraea solani]